MDTPDQSAKDKFQALQQQVMNPWEGPSYIKGAVLWFFAAGVAACLFLFGPAPPAWNHDWHGGLLTLGVIVPPIALTVAHCRSWNRKVIPLLDAVSGQNDPRHLDILLFFAATTSPAWIRRVKAPLLRILAQIQRADAVHLSSEAQGRMHRILEGSDAEMILALLKALPNIGTVSALSFVEPHAKGATWPSRDPRIQEAAQQCHAILTARVDSVTGNGPERTLLRAASAPGDTSILLRPAASGETSPAEQLLRAQS